jgi:hypothetical protein
MIRKSLSELREECVMWPAVNGMHLPPVQSLGVGVYNCHTSIFAPGLACLGLPNRPSG